jgi:uncharacterized protein (TIGR02271 family)
MSPSVTPEASIPLVEEHVTVDKRVVETGRVRIRTVVDERLARVAADLERDDVTVERVPVNREVAEPPQMREEDGVLIIPILEEVAVVEKRLFLKEELHIHRNRERERVEEAVRLKSMRPEVQRVGTAAPADSNSEQEPGRRAPSKASKLRRKERVPSSRR